ncbi:putative Phosphatase DUF89 [Novymonas esmeraldas]|uniref:Phosphatase DUF89 n=1 Tax=Novymonas esmeraldas TaxID=1808958 RepID=A0AAW0F778_9TRYP
MKGIGRQSFLVVFDFDHTVVDCNTDEVIPAALGRREMQRSMMAEEHRMQWTKLMDTLIAPFSKEELTRAAHESVVMDPAMPSVFQYLIDTQQRHATPGAAATAAAGDARAAAVRDNTPGVLEINIASDANLLFIEAALDARLPGVREHVSQIHSNPYYDLTAPGVAQDAGRDRCYGPGRPADSPNVDDEAERDARYNSGLPRKSRVCWYEPYGHDCACCLAGGKPNMRKSTIVERLLQTTSLIDPTIIFVGDGANDYCPVLNVLRPRDYVFARRDFPLHRLLAGGDAGSVGGCCHVGLWSGAAELLGLMQLALEHPGARLPTLVRFRDAAAREFRTVTMATRIPAVLRRTLEELGNASSASAAGRQRVAELIRGAEANELVPPLPGQACVPAWLRNYAYVAEYDRVCADDVARRVSPAAAAGDVNVIAPRWGQVPWLHGEIYFYHLLWQYLMLRDDDAAEAATEAAAPSFNVITPHALHNPLFSQQCGVATTPGMVSPAVVARQSARDVATLVCDPAFIADSVVARRVRHGCDGPATLVPYAELVRQPSGCVVPNPAALFSAYRDIFSHEKREVLMSFLAVRVVPMLACRPWDAGRDYGGILLRWMLWGNGIDLSMFTLEQLASAHGTATGDAARGDVGAEVAALQAAERTASLAQDANLVGNEVAGVEAHLRRLLDPADTAIASRQIDIVMDNVGVECISDLCFGVWYVHQCEQRGLPARVVYHVKSMPYYVSDVTPRDLDLTLAELEATYAGGGDGRAEPDAVKRATLEAALAPFIAQVRACFARGSFAVDADTVWTQPSEYRDLPPRVVNRYFYTQHVSTPAAAADATVATGAVAAAAVAAATAVAAVAAAAVEAVVGGRSRLPPRGVHARSGLVIFKGDLNYRRLIGDRYWDRSDFLTTLARSDSPNLRTAPADYTAEEQAIVAELTQDTPATALMDSPTFREVLSAYWPTHAVPVCSIRTIKSECCVGVPGDTKARLDQQHGLQWRVSGKYGEILFAC